MFLALRFAIHSARGLGTLCPLLPLVEVIVAICPYESLGKIIRRAMHADWASKTLNRTAQSNYVERPSLRSLPGFLCDLCGKLLLLNTT